VGLVRIIGGLTLCLVLEALVLAAIWLGWL
jgi:hypothetical protein